MNPRMQQKNWAKRKMPAWLILTVLITSVVFINLFFFSSSSRIQLYVICADSLMTPFNELASQFEAENPEIDVIIEGHGSIQVIRHVTELGTVADLIAVADYSLIPMLMYDNKIPGTSKDYANWYIKFATNKLGFVYTTGSKDASIINKSNWFEILSQSDVKIGLPIPHVDSCGYRALMMCQLAEEYYSNFSIFENVLGAFSPPISINNDTGIYNISVPEVLNPLKDITLRGSSLVLSILIESGTLDYSFEYESVAKQRGLEFLEFAPEIDLSSENCSENYNNVLVQLQFQRFTSVIPQFYGEAIKYALTIPKNSLRENLAIKFIEFLLGEKGQKILSDCYQPMLLPLEINNPENMPAALRIALEI